MTENKEDKIRTLIAWLDDQLNAKGVMLWIKQCPDLADDFWARWDQFDVECLGYIKGDVPVSMIRELALMLISFVGKT